MSSSTTKFVTPLQNDYQWRNLYMRQFGTCTYPPPLPKNPSTTTSSFPKRTDILNFLGDLDSDGEEDYTTVETAHRKALSRQETFFSITDNFCDDEDEDADAKKSSTTSPAEAEAAKGDRTTPASNEGDHELAGVNFFSFLNRSRTSRQDGLDVTARTSASLPSIGLTTHQQVNPHRIPREIFNLHQDAWALLMDNRAMVWLEREASEKGQTATQVRRRLLEVVAGPNSSMLQPWKKITLDRAITVPDEPPISEQAAFQRIFEGFQPFFAVISNPSILRRLRDQFMASRRSQTRGLVGTAADTVGFPLFSQFSTWQEAYEQRKMWNCTPFSFFVVHDASFNFANISAMFVMLKVIHEHCHTHSNKCLSSCNTAVILEDASKMLTNYKNIRRAAEQQRFLCPLFAMQQLTEDILIAFEQSASRTTLTMAMQVCGFLTDCVIDPETAARFISKDALQRQRTNQVPGMNVARAPTPGDRHTDSSSIPTEADYEAEREKEVLEVFAVKRFSDADFESLFELTYYFVDAARANSTQPIEPRLLPAARNAPIGHPNEINLDYSTSIGSTVNFTRRRKTRGSPGASTTRRRSPSSVVGASSVASPTPPPPANENNMPSEHQYIPGRVKRHSPVGSLAEAITVYETRRQTLLHQQREASSSHLSDTAVGRKRKNSTSAAHSPNATVRDKATSACLSPSTTVLSTPLIFITSYIRLHGAPWLKNLFNRIFNILRRESVLLYVNHLDIEETQKQRQNNSGSSTPTLATTPDASGNINMNVSVSMMSGKSHKSMELDPSLCARLERLEDLVCQDILFVINEFFSALHGKRSATRLPQGITTLISQFTSTIHLHLLRNLVLSNSEAGMRPGAASRKVKEYLYILKQKRMVGKAVRSENISDASVSRLISSIEQYRLTKFILFDSWIIPTLNTAVASGYLSETSSLHLRWNIDAFARYLKVMVNAPFIQEETNRRAASPMPAPPPTSVSSPEKNNFSPRRRKRMVKEPAVTAPLTTPLPRFITGIYDVASGSLVRMCPPPPPTPHPASSEHGSVTMVHNSQTMNPHEKRSSGDASETSVALISTVMYGQPRVPYKVVDYASWEEISTALKGLNEALGIVGYDPEEETDVFSPGNNGAFTEEECAMHVLDQFCGRAIVESSNNVVVSEFAVLPSLAAACLDKIYDMMTGAHPLVEQAMRMGVMPSTFRFSPYLACLHGTLLHPRSAAQALDNVFYNSRRFYQTLMRPVEDDGLLQLVSALLVDQDDLPIVDSNALMPLFASMPSQPGRHAPLSLAGKWETEARKIKQQRAFLTNGGLPSLSRGVNGILQRAGPIDPMKIIKAGRDIIEKEAHVVPLCFDPWWRAMCLSLCVKVMTVFTECSHTHADSFELWCKHKVDESNKQHRQMCDGFITTKGKTTLDPVPAKARRSNRTARSSVQTMSTSPASTRTASTKPRKPKRKKKAAPKKPVAARA